MVVTRGPFARGLHKTTQQGQSVSGRVCSDDRCKIKNQRNCDIKINENPIGLFVLIDAMIRKLFEKWRKRRRAASWRSLHSEENGLRTPPIRGQAPSSKSEAISKQTWLHLVQVHSDDFANPRRRRTKANQAKEFLQSRTQLKNFFFLTN